MLPGADSPAQESSLPVKDGSDTYALIIRICKRIAHLVMLFSDGKQCKP